MDFEYVTILMLNVGHFDHEHYKCRFEMDRQKNSIEPCTENQINFLFNFSGFIQYVSKGQLISKANFKVFI